ncbi:CI-B8 domain-containing protein [Xylaria sp. FL1777]|nr:CI-B8 domain-containing protein [Xylaria sp. FL1777]
MAWTKTASIKLNTSNNSNWFRRNSEHRSSQPDKMVNPGSRMHKLQVILSLRLGPGAAILPPEITRIHMDFAVRIDDGHMGPRKFWRHCLPRLKYWNPAVPMIVNRGIPQDGPAIMSIYFRKRESTSLPSPNWEEIVRNMPPLAQQPHSSITHEHPAPLPEKDETVTTINMKNKHSDEILLKFLRETGAAVVHPTPDETNEIRQIEARVERAVVDRGIVKKYIERRRRQERALAIARQEAEEIKILK